jgi:NADPH-dependent F420 reductase
MKIAILGSGSVGSTLGRSWAAKGHEIVFGARDPKSPRVQDALKSAGAKARAASLKDAAAAAEVVVLATPYDAAQDALRAAGALAGKVVIDATNPLKQDLSGLVVGHTTSAAETIAGWAKGAKIVKCFNTIGAEHMGNPKVAGQTATMFLCGDDAGAKKTAERLAQELGFEPIDAGPLRQARLLEPLALLWITLAFQQKLGTGIAFKLLRG